jgi:hypothetical protein
MDRDIERAEEAYRWKRAGYWSYMVLRAEEFMGNTVARVRCRVEVGSCT